MNIYLIIILTGLIMTYFVDTLALWMNLKSLSPDLPEEFTGVYNSSEYARSQEYTKIKTSLEFIESFFDLCVLIIFWFIGGFNWVDILIRNYNFHPIINGLLYFAILMSAKHIISLPFDIYSTFVIEEKFGFNKTTIKTFISDQIKSILLMALIGGLVLSGLLAFFQWAGALAWLYGWIAVTLFIILLQFIAPTWIMPIFNKFTPIEDGDLKAAIMNYANSVNFPIQGLFVMDGSKRSSKSNAFFTGFGKNKRIALFDTLIEKHTIPELVVILAHEIGHYKKKHILKSMIISVLEMGVFFYLLSIFISQQGIYDAFFIKNMSFYTGLLLFFLLYSPISFIVSIFTNIFSRHNEYEADGFAVETTKDAKSFIDSLKKLTVSNLSNLTPNPFYVFLHYSHPPLLQRIKKKYRNKLKTNIK
ncbi:M48 family metallopeptidase [Candidatus Poribacteria bacterium]|nr:M48 family metallopeptidase [Candidatus Poribacteria bacterium]